MTYFDLTCDIVLTVRVGPDCDDFRLGSCTAFVGVTSDVDGVLRVRPQTLYFSGCFTVHHNTLYLFAYKENQTGYLQKTKLVSYSSNINLQVVSVICNTFLMQEKITFAYY